MASLAKKDWVYFRKNQVVVKYRGQAPTLKVIRLDIPPANTMPSVPGGFTPHRPVINLKFEDTSQPNKAILTFVPPVEVRVRYDDTDITASASDPPLLAYWDKTRWVYFTVLGNQFHRAEWSPTKKKGWLSVNIYEWGDPTIGMGR